MQHSILLISTLILLQALLVLLVLFANHLGVQCRGEEEVVEEAGRLENSEDGEEKRTDDRKEKSLAHTFPFSGAEHQHGDSVGVAIEVLKLQIWNFANSY